MSSRFVDQFRAICFDVNGTIMFGGDRLDEGQGFFRTYTRLGGGRLTADRVHFAVRETCRFLSRAYEDPARVDSFSSVAEAIRSCTHLAADEASLIERVISMHEIGAIPEWASRAIKVLSQTHAIAIVSNIWSPSLLWREELARTELIDICHFVVFSSEIGSIKPSQQIFTRALEALSVPAHQVLFVGDSLERDIRPAKALGMATAWVASEGFDASADVRIDMVTELLSRPV
jgi:FMN phosphatase YigB (HAD superfamily)